MAPLLAALPPEEYEALRPHLRRVRLEAQQVLHWPNEPITRVYFPISSVLSLLTVLDEGAEVEAGLVGSEGVLGLPAPRIASYVRFGLDAITASVRNLSSQITAMLDGVRMEAGRAQAQAQVNGGHDLVSGVLLISQPGEAQRLHRIVAYAALRACCSTALERSSRANGLPRHASPSTSRHRSPQSSR